MHTPRPIPPRSRRLPRALRAAARALLCGWLIACVYPRALSDEGTSPDPNKPAPAQDAWEATLASAWQRPFWSHSAWVMELGVGGGGVGGQMAQALEGGGFQITLNTGWRLGPVSLEAPLTIQRVESSVVSSVLLTSWGARARLHLPLLGGSVRLLGGAGLYATWAAVCTEDEASPCEHTSQDAPKLQDYRGHTWETSLGVATPLLSVWTERGGAGGVTGGTELLLSVEYRRLWHDLHNDTLSRTLHGHIDAVTVNLGFELMLVD